MDVYQLRRLNLQRLVDERFQGNQSLFASACEMSRSQAQQLLTQKNMGAQLARKIEALCQLPAYGLDQPTQETTNMTDTTEGTDDIRKAVDRLLREIVPDLNRHQCFDLLHYALTLLRQPPKK